LVIDFLIQAIFSSVANSAHLAMREHCIDCGAGLEHHEAMWPELMRDPSLEDSLRMTVGGVSLTIMAGLVGAGQRRAGSASEARGGILGDKDWPGVYCSRF
jgi:hypothetical protein